MAENRYRHLPDHCFWTRGVTNIAADDLNPIVSAPFLIARSDKIMTAGSCFAQHIGRYLKECGLNYLLTEPPHPIMSEDEAVAYNYETYTARYGNICTVRQLLSTLEQLPSYEIITGSHARGRFFAEDCRSVTEAGVAHVMRVFLGTFAGLDVKAGPAHAPAPTEDSERGMHDLVAVSGSRRSLCGPNYGGYTPRS